MSIKSGIWDIFISWLFTPKGATFIALAGTSVMTILSIFTSEFVWFRPFSYGVVFFLGFFLLLLLIHFMKKIFGEKLYKVETKIEFYFDGSSLHAEGRENIWGWRSIFVSALTNSETQAVTSIQWIISACFDKPITTDTIHCYRLEHHNNILIPVDWINFEPRYANIRLVLSEPGNYRIEYKP